MKETTVKLQAVRCVLVAPPWPLFNRPSIQIAALKAFLDKRAEGVHVENHHPYLYLYDEIGPVLYNRIAQSSWASEAFGAVLLQPEREDALRVFVQRALEDRGGAGITEEEFKCAVKGLKNAIHRFMDKVKWHAVDLLGITVSLNQLTCALYMAKKVKSSYPHVKVAIGGAGVPGAIGAAILEQYGCVDFCISGEGEAALLHLVDGVRSKRPLERGLLVGTQIKDLDSLPIPDFSPYFKELMGLSPSKRFIPVLPVEFSRGCYWSKCTFCNLNLQWKGYRKKSWKRMVDEVIGLSERFRSLDFAFMDNALPPKEALAFFSSPYMREKDLWFFGELRAPVSRKDAHAFVKGGLKEAQVGIEALSPSLIHRMRKGTGVMENISTMRNLLEAGIELKGNLIVDFPGTTPHEIEETLECLGYCMCFRPLKPVSFWLGYGSPVFEAPETFGIRGKRPHKNYETLLGRRGNWPHMVFEYWGNVRKERGMWAPVREKIQSWERFWERHASKRIPPLTYREGGDFMVVRQVKEDGTVLHHKFHGISKEVFCACLDPMEPRALLARFPTLHAPELESFLKELMHKGLLFSDGFKVLALPIRIS